MFAVAPATREFLCAAPTDMRRGYDGLYGLVAGVVQLNCVAQRIDWVSGNACGSTEAAPPAVATTAMNTAPDRNGAEDINEPTSGYKRTQEPGIQTP